MGNPRPKEKNIIKDVRNLFKLQNLKKESIYTTIKDIRNIFEEMKKLKKEYLDIEEMF